MKKELSTFELQLCDIQGRLFELALKNDIKYPDFAEKYMNSQTAAFMDYPYDRLQWAGEEYILENLMDEVIPGEKYELVLTVLKGGAFALSSFVPSASHIAATKLDGFEAHAEKGQIRYRAEAGTTLVITDAAGVELARFQADGEGTFGGLVHGIYMISATKGSRSATLKVAL